MIKEKLYRRLPAGLPSLPNLGQISTLMEVFAFLALSGTVIAVAAKGIAIATGLVGILVVGVYLTAAIGLFITFVSLLVLSILLDGYQGYVEYLKYLMSGESEEDEEANR